MMIIAVTDGFLGYDGRDEGGAKPSFGVLGGTRRQQSAPRSREAHLASAAFARELGELG